MREGAAFRVLAGQPDRNSFDEQRAERERLGLAPVDPTFLDRREPALELPHQLRMDGEMLGDAQQLLVQLPQPFGCDGGDDTVAARERDLALRRMWRAERRLQRLMRLLQLRGRSEEHTSELQSRQYLVCRL